MILVRDGARCRGGFYNRRLLLSGASVGVNPWPRAAPPQALKEPLPPVGKTLQCWRGGRRSSLHQQSGGMGRTPERVSSVSRNCSSWREKMLPFPPTSPTTIAALPFNDLAGLFLNCRGQRTLRENSRDKESVVLKYIIKHKDQFNNVHQSKTVQKKIFYKHFFNGSECV